MLLRIIVGITLVTFISLGSMLILEKMKSSKLETDNRNLNKAVSAYEELIKVVPFNRVVEERNENAEDEINATLSNVNAIHDGSYKL